MGACNENSTGGCCKAHKGILAIGGGARIQEKRCMETMLPELAKLQRQLLQEQSCACTCTCTLLQGNGQ